MSFEDALKAIREEGTYIYFLSNEEVQLDGDLTAEQLIALGKGMLEAQEKGLEFDEYGNIEKVNSK